MPIFFICIGALLIQALSFEHCLSRRHISILYTTYRLVSYNAIIYQPAPPMRRHRLLVPVNPSRPRPPFPSRTRIPPILKLVFRGPSPQPSLPDDSMRSSLSSTQTPRYPTPVQPSQDLRLSKIPRPLAAEGSLALRFHPFC